MCLTRRRFLVAAGLAIAAAPGCDTKKDSASNPDMGPPPNNAPPKREAPPSSDAKQKKK